MTDKQNAENTCDNLRENCGEVNMTDKQMPDEVWISDIDGSHCRCWSGPTYGGFKGEGHLSTSYTRTDIVQALRDQNQRLKAAAIDLRAAQEAYISYVSNCKDEPEHKQERERLGKIVGKKAELLDKAIKEAGE